VVKRIDNATIGSKKPTTRNKNENNRNEETHTKKMIHTRSNKNIDMSTRVSFDNALVSARQTLGAVHVVERITLLQK
jgi:hypothetical protein